MSCGCRQDTLCGFCAFCAFCVSLLFDGPWRDGGFVEPAGSLALVGRRRNGAIVQLEQLWPALLGAERELHTIDRPTSSGFVLEQQAQEGRIDVTPEPKSGEPRP